MAKYKWLGPGDVLLYEGKEYRPGDAIDMTPELMEHHAVFAGYRFEGFEELAVASPPADLANKIAARDDRGQIILNVPRGDAGEPIEPKDVNPKEGTARDSDALKEDKPAAAPKR